MLRTIKRACTAVCVLHVCASVVPFFLSDIDGAAARALRSVPLVLYVVQWATVLFVVRLVCLFKARLGPYAKPLTVWTAVACVCGVVQIPLMAVGFDVEGGENIERNSHMTRHDTMEGDKTRHTWTDTWRHRDRQANKQNGQTDRRR